MRRPSDEKNSKSPKSEKTRRKRTLARSSIVKKNAPSDKKSGLEVDLSQNELKDIFASIALGESESPALAMNLIYEKALDAIADTVKSAFISFTSELGQEKLTDIAFLDHVLSDIDPEKLKGFADGFLTTIDQSRDKIKLSLGELSQNAISQAGGREFLLRTSALSQESEHHAIPVFGKRISNARLREIFEEIQKNKKPEDASKSLALRPNQSINLSFNNLSASSASPSTASGSLLADADREGGESSDLAESGSELSAMPEDVLTGEELVPDCEAISQKSRDESEVLPDTFVPEALGNGVKASEDSDSQDGDALCESVKSEVEHAQELLSSTLDFSNHSDLAMDFLAEASQSLGEALPKEWLEILASLGQDESPEQFGHAFKDLAEGFAESMSAVALEFARVSLEAEAELKSGEEQLESLAQDARLLGLKEDERVASDEALLELIDFLEAEEGPSHLMSKESQDSVAIEKELGQDLSNEDLAEAFALLLEQFDP